MRTPLLHILLCGLALLLGAVIMAPEASGRRFVVTLDAGHGGTDTGAIGKKAKEKDITLSVAKALGRVIKDKCPEADVRYTRSSDVFVPLADRAAKANEAHSDLFVSIHVNSVAKRNRNRTTIEGCQVYTLGLHKTEENLAVARRENAVMELEDDHTQKYAGFDPESPESDIVFELSQNKRMDQSIELADAMHRELASTAHRAAKGVRQAGFWVLWACAMPSVLVELDFICNPHSEDYLSSAEGQRQMAEALYNAFASYYNTYAHEVVGAKFKPLARIEGIEDSKPLLAAIPEPPEEKTEDFKDTPKREERESLTPRPSEWRIQILASTKLLPSGYPQFKGAKDVTYYREGQMYKYTVGSYSTADEARSALKEARHKFPEAFLVELNNGHRVGFAK